MKKAFFIMLMGILSVMSIFACGKYKQISQDEAKKIMDTRDDIIIVDVRTPDEYQSGHIENAINIPLQTIKTEPAQLPDKEQTILVCCRSGRRSKMASRKLADLGYKNIMEFGGITTWQYGIKTPQSKKD